MSSRNLTRRLERLEAELAPDKDPDVLTITVTRMDKPGQVKVLKFVEPRRKPARPGDDLMYDSLSC